MEGNKTTEKITEKKMDDYRNGDLNNFAGENELLVTITLNEYRELVSEVAKKKADIDEERTAKWKAQNENTELKKEVEMLHKKIQDLLFKYEYAKCTAEGVSEDA